jgi:hypothetical protein
MSDEHDTAGTPAAAGSPLSSLRDRRKARRKKLHLDLKVPGYDPAIFVRFQPASQSKLISEIKRAEKSKDQHAIALANASLLIDACQGVFQVDEHKREVSIDPDNLTADPSEWLKFGPELGELLADKEAGELLVKASDVARALYDNDMALGAAADRLIEWSRTMNEELERENEGN